MIYPYKCHPCLRTFEVIKSVAEIDHEELCERCYKPAERTIAKVNLVAVHDWTETFNPAFGRVVKNKAHQREIIKELKDQGKEFEEIGNEPVENVHKYYDNIRKERQEDRWSESADKIIKEVLN